MTLSAAQLAKSLRRFQKDIARRFMQVSISENIIASASSLAVKYALRGYDAVQLASALAANRNRILNGLAPLVLVSADKELNAAAKAEGFKVEYPNDYP